MLKIDFSDYFEAGERLVRVFLLKKTSPSTGFIHALR